MAELKKTETLTRYTFEFTEKELVDLVLVLAQAPITAVNKALYGALSAPLHVAAPSDRVGE